MLKKKNLSLPTYNDGVVSILRDSGGRVDFDASRGDIPAMCKVVSLAYEEKSCREQDFEFAKLRGFTLTKKVKTHCYRDVDADCKAVIGDDLFGISHIDRSKREMYLYLSSVGKYRRTA